MLKKQKFGVEIEMTGITRQEAASIISLHFGHSGRVSGNRTVYNTFKIRDEQDRIWQIMRDSSVAGGGQTSVELVTPPLKYDDIELLQNIVRKLKGAGAKVDRSCGIHIHVDGANHTPQSLRRIVNFMTARQDLIYEALEIGSRAYSWCKKLSPSLIADMKSKKELSRAEIESIWYSPSNDNYCGGISHEHYNRTRYNGVNLHSYFSKGTVEFRLFNSTLHAGKIKAYIQFCLAVSAWAITSKERVVFRSMENYTSAQKVTIMRNILTQRLGLCGDEFKTCRLHLMTPLKKAAGMIARAA